MRIRGFCLYVISVFCVLAIYCSAGLAQTRGTNDATLEIVVKDPAGALIHSAVVQLAREGKTNPAVQTNQKGEARFVHVVPGLYQIQVEAPGFKPRSIDSLELHAGLNRTEVTLEIDVIKADVEVADEARVKNSDPNGPTFTNILTADQIAQLPDDPDELENAINQLAGPGAQLRVNGFKGGKLPPKSQIREIRFRMNPYAAENHDAGFGFRDESLNGRQAFAKFRGPEQQRRFGLAMDGPIWKNRTSLFLNADGSLFYDAKTIV